MRIVTVTLNPAIDIHINMKKLIPGRENYITSLSRRAAGKGVNVARTLKVLRTEATAVVAAGGGNADSYFAELSQDGIRFLPHIVPGNIRENINIHEENGQETRINCDSFALNAKDLTTIYDRIQPDSDTIVALCGRLPLGISGKPFDSFFRKIKKTGAKTVLDSSSFSIAELAELKPWMIKPNLLEATKDVELPKHSKAYMLSLAQRLSDSGIEHVLISMGKEGGVYASHNTQFSITVPEIDALSEVGAGDSTVAGFISAYSQGLNIRNCLATAFACGSAACLTPGTEPPKLSNIRNLRLQITVE